MQMMLICYLIVFRRSESPPEVFIIIMSWLIEILRHISENQWGNIIVSYDNMPFGTKA